MKVRIKDIQRRGMDTATTDSFFAAQTDRGSGPARYARMDTAATESFVVVTLPPQELGRTVTLIDMDSRIVDEKSVARPTGRGGGREFVVASLSVPFPGQYMLHVPKYKYMTSIKVEKSQVIIIDLEYGPARPEWGDAETG